MKARSVRVVFCWAEISGYMAACFQELVTASELGSFVIALASGRATSAAQFSDEVLAGVPSMIVDGGSLSEKGKVVEEVLRQRPDVIVLCGWFIPAYRKILSDPRFANVPIIMTMDTPWWGRPKQWLGRFALRKMLRRVSLMVVTGERSWQYAIRLGIPQEKIRRGMYGVDYRGLSECLERRLASEWPKRFLFAGRYAPEKAIDVMLAGYREYRARIASTGMKPWPLVCCGAGKLKGLLADQVGVEDRGFVQPADMRQEMTNAGAFLLPSRFDPWPLAVVEACAAGLPVIASEACGSTVEMIRPDYNGYLVPTGNADALADTLVRAHGEYEMMPEYGRRANQFAAAYSAEVWAKRWEGFVRELVSGW